MTILALEFSSSHRSAAVWQPACRRDELHEFHSGPVYQKLKTRATCPSEGTICEAVETGGHGTNAFRLIERVLAEAGLERRQIEVIAVGLGPGSYTGIRVALSIAQGWQLACGVKLLGISSAECLAAQAQAERILGRVNVVIDAQRNEFYRASYEISSSGCKEMGPLQIMSLTGLPSLASTDEIWVGPEVTRWFSKGKILFPSAATLGRLAAGRRHFTDGDKLMPIYLREANFVKAPPPNPVVF